MMSPAWPSCPLSLMIENGSTVSIVYPLPVLPLPCGSWQIVTLSVLVTDAWAEPLVIRTSPPDIITTLSAPSTAAVLTRHELLPVAFLLLIEATRSSFLPRGEATAPPQRHAGREEGKPSRTMRTTHRLGSQDGPPAWPRTCRHRTADTGHSGPGRPRTTGLKRVILNGNSDHMSGEGGA